MQLSALSQHGNSPGFEENLGRCLEGFLRPGIRCKKTLHISDLADIHFRAPPIVLFGRPRTRALDNLGQVLYQLLLPSILSLNQIGYGGKYLRANFADRVLGLGQIQGKMPASGAVNMNGMTPLQAFKKGLPTGPEKVGNTRSTPTIARKGENSGEERGLNDYPGQGRGSEFPISLPLARPPREKRN